MGRWVHIKDGPGSPAAQMARDRALFSLVRLSFPCVVRTWWSDRTGATVGRTHRDPVPEEWGVDPGDVVVRPTGGGGVLHGQDLCISFLLPFGPDLSRSRNWPAFYESVHEALAGFLRSMGQSPVMLPACPEKRGMETRGPVRPGLCFQGPVRGDLMRDGRKILGGALAVGRTGLLYQGSLLLPERDPGSLSDLFEKWYCLEGRKAFADVLSEDHAVGRRRG